MSGTKTEAATLEEPDHRHKRTARAAENQVGDASPWN